MKTSRINMLESVIYCMSAGEYRVEAETQHEGCAAVVAPVTRRLPGRDASAFIPPRPVGWKWLPSGLTAWEPTVSRFFPPAHDNGDRTRLGQTQCEEMGRLRAKYKISPLVIHTSYLVNLASATPEFHRKSVEAFRGELQRALALCADYLVLHPGSFRGRSREEGLQLVAQSIAEAAEGLGLENGNLMVLIENTAGAEFSLGGSFEQVAHLLEYLRPVCPVGACIDTCHTHVCGYDIVSENGYEQTMKHLEESIRLAERSRLALQ